MPVRLYYMTAKQWAPVILREKRLKISTIPELNDPFELLGASIGEDGMRRALDVLQSHWARNLGLICLTDNWHSPVMWAHYADKHYGICFGFDVSDRPDLISKVDYVPDRLRERLTLDRSRWDKDQELLVQILRTKYSDWSYESEYRVFVELKDKEANGLYYLDFGPEFILREVILGARCPLQPRDLAKEIKNPPESVEVFKARPAFDSFQIVREEKVEPTIVNPIRFSG
jgi:hypothetical protein